MSKITPAYNGLTAARADLVTESASGQLPFAGGSHVFGCHFCHLDPELGFSYRLSQRRLESNSGGQSLPGTPKTVGIMIWMGLT